MLVAVLGASPKRERYSNKAVRKLLVHGHQVVPVNPAHASIEGLVSVPSLAEIKEPVDTVSVYVGPAHIGPLIEDIVALHPRRVIANPGTESLELANRLQQEGIKYEEACTLVLLATEQF